MHRPGCALVVGLCLVACSGEDLWVEIAFPDEEAKQQAQRIRVVAIEPSDGASCEALLAGVAGPGDVGYDIENEVELTLAATGQARPLDGVGPGVRLFYAEAYRDSGPKFLHGCAQAEAGHGGSGGVRISLVPACQPTHAGVETCDGLDNDCDGQTDEGDPVALCESIAHGTATACTSGACTYDCDEGWFDTNGERSDGCECRQTRGGEEVCDGLDNDCDGQADEAPCTGCSGDADCVSLGDCLQGTCVDNACQVEWLADASPCDDGDVCTVGDSCHERVCAGSSLDCSDGLDCTEDLCDPDGNCENPVGSGFCLIAGVCYRQGDTSAGSVCLVCDPDTANQRWTTTAGASCDDGLWCNGEDICADSGVCVHGGDICHAVCQVCDEQNDACLTANPGGDCDDGVECTLDDRCDEAGACRGTPEDGACPAGMICVPDCAQQADGCIVVPESIELNCPADAPGGQPAVCTLQVPEAPQLAACVQCSASLLPSTISMTDFSDDALPDACSLDGWQLESQGCADPGAYSDCPLPWTEAQDPCCTEEACALLDANAYWEAAHPSCSGDGFRLVRPLDLTGYQDVSLCFGLSHWDGAERGSVLQVQVDSTDPRDARPLFCLEGYEGFQDPTQQISPWCLDLPDEVLQWPSSRVVFWAQVPRTGTWRLYHVELVGYPPECPRQANWRVFDSQGCPFDGWNIHGTFNCDGFSSCQAEGLRIGGSFPGTGETTLERDVDLSAATDRVWLCWEQAEEGQHLDAEVSLTVDGRWPPLFYRGIWREESVERCQPICVELTEQGVVGNPNVRIELNFTLRGSLFSGTLGVTRIWMEASQPCEAPEVLEVVGPDPVGAEQTFEVRLRAEHPRPVRARLECQLGQATARRSIQFGQP